MSLQDRCIAISGCAQHAWWAHRLAQHGEYREDRLRSAAASILCTDPETAETVFGGLSQLRTGLEMAASLFSGRGDGPVSAQESALITGYCGQLLRLGSQVMTTPALRDRLGKGIDAIKADFPDFTPDNGDEVESISARLAQLYVDNISPLTPRIMIQGNGIYLRNERFAAGIRTHLLAAVRAAVLWRQTGGRLWLLMFQRAVYQREIQRLMSQRSI